LGNRDLASAVTLEEGRPATHSRIAVACVLAWLLPGAGHWFLGRRVRAAVFFGLVTLSFVLGIVFHGRFSVMDGRQPLLSALQVVACLGTGPLEIVARTSIYGAPIYKMPAEDEVSATEVRRPRTVVGRTLRSRNEHFDSPYGTAYLWTAGLMNLLLILDVFDIGVRRKT
jgi:hypothetical protein